MPITQSGGVISFTNPPTIRQFYDTGVISEVDFAVAAKRNLVKQVKFLVNPTSSTAGTLTLQCDIDGDTTLNLTSLSANVAVFKTMQPITGTSPVAASMTDTLNFASSDSSIGIAGNSSTDTLDFSVASGIFAKLAGVSGGQTLYGGTAASNNLDIRSTSNSTKGLVKIAADGGRVVVGNVTDDATNNFQVLMNAAVNGAAGTTRELVLETAGVKRFSVQVDSAAESGAKAGSNFQIIAYDDSGANPFTAWYIKRTDYSIGINNTNPTATLHLLGNANYLQKWQNGSTVGAIYVDAFSVQMGSYTNSDFGFWTGNGNYLVFMKHSTQKVGIGNTSPGYKLDVTGDGRFTTDFRVEGTVAFAGTNSTGSGSALLATNCPAVTATAPYTWITAKSADGSTVYIPCWK